ncbi:hypothetical protein D3C86_1619990 [compost metagenome]
MRVMIIDMVIPIIGAKTMKAIIFKVASILMAWIGSAPRIKAYAIPDPAKPPINVWEELEGTP